MMNFVMHLEESLNIDFSSLEFDVVQNSVGDIERLRRPHNRLPNNDCRGTGSHSSQSTDCVVL